MKAVVRESNEKGMIFKTDQQKPDMPKPGSDDILIRVKGASINPVDYKAPEMVLGKAVGLDFAGVVEAVAEGAAHGFKVGDEVFGGSKGTLAEFTLTQAKHIARKPAGLSFTEAASLPTAYMTGLQALRDHGQLKEGGKAIIIGASGGCGVAGVQLARSLGAKEVVGVCSAKNKEIVERLGATRVVDYNTEKIDELFGNLPEEEKFDTVYDAATGSGGGEEYEAASWQVLKQTGQYVPINGGAMTWFWYTVGWQASRKHLFLTDMKTADLDTLSGLIADRKLETLIAKTLPFTEAGVDEAFSLLKGRRTVGKLVVDMEQQS